MSNSSNDDKKVALYTGPPNGASNTKAEKRPFEVEDEPDGTPPPPSWRNRIFPCRPFHWCPNVFCFWVPPVMQEIQDFSHFFLTTGVMAMMLLGVFAFGTLWRVYGIGIIGTDFFGSREIGAIALIFLVIPYCVSILQQYDQRLADKQAEARAAKEELSQKYQDLCNEMHTTLDKFAEYTGAYAQNIFESKYRSFGHWAKQVASGMEIESKLMTEGERSELKEEFRKMCMNWFRVLSECGINPSEKPIILCKKEELDKLDTFTDIAKLVQERCIPPKITVQNNQPKSDVWQSHMKGFCPNCDTTYSVAQSAAMRGRCQKCTKAVIGLTYWLEEVPVWKSTRPGTCLACKEWFSPQQAWECDAVCPRCHGDIQELKPVTQELHQQQQNFKKEEIHAKQQAKRFSQDMTLAPQGAANAARTLARSGEAQKRWFCPSWLLITKGFSCNKEVGEKPGGYPTTYNTCCLSMRIFSLEHIKLLLGCLVCLCICLLNFYWIICNMEKGAQHKMQTMIEFIFAVLAQVGLLTLLCRFEDLDVVMRLEQETTEMLEEKERVETTNKTVQETFGMLQKMNVVWLNRTIPRLDLMNEISNKLCDVDQNTSKSEWIHANQALTNMEVKIGTIQDWVGDDKLSEAEKKKFGTLMRGVYQEENVKDMIGSLQLLNNDKLGFLKALEPPPADKPMVDLDELAKRPTVNFHNSPIVISNHDSERTMLDV